MNHLTQIANKLAEYGLDAMLITSASGEHYALGMDGEGVCIITPNTVHYSTDGRYIEAAQEQISGATIHQIGRDKNHLQLAKIFLKQQGIVHLGFESDDMTVDSHIRWAEGLSSCILTPAGTLIPSLRACKDEDELNSMREAQKITDESFAEILNFIKVGRTEQEVAAQLVYEMLRRGARKTSFDTIVAAGANGSRPHAIPSDRIIQSGMFVTMDFGCMVDGYCSDMTRTIAVGTPTEEMELVYHTVFSAQLAGISVARVGVTGKEVDSAARKVITDAGFGPYFSHGFGHSLGLEIHESPNASASETAILQDGVVISAEPGIYLPGRFGVRIEDVIVIRQEGCDILTHSPKHLITL